MRRFIIIIIILAVAHISIFAELPVDFYIRSEYKKDTIDYNDIIKNYYRKRVAIFFSQESALNISYIYVDHENDKKFTWNLILNDISSNSSFLIGNFFTHLGAGLLLGRKRTYDPDPFAIKLSDTTETKNKSPFTSCNTGSPMFAFNGLAGTFSGQIQEIKLSLNAFYSINERFIDEESYELKKISSTIETIDNKTASKYNHNEPVEIHTSGIMLCSSIFNSITMEAYFLNANIKSKYKEEIQWEYDSGYNESNGISKLNGFGMFAQYKDDFLCIFTEGVLSQKEVIKNDNERKKEYGYGILYGLKFTPPIISISFSGKEVQSTFYSPYSSSIGEDYPESAFFLNTEVKPYDNLRLIAKLSSQKKNAPSSNDSTLPTVIKENLSIAYSYKILEKFAITLKRRERTDDKKEDDKNIQASSDIAVSDAFKIKLSATYKHDNNANPSRIFDTGFQLIPFTNLKIDIHYLVAHISQYNQAYIIVAPIKDSSTQGIFIRQDSEIIVIKSDLKINGIYLSCRFFYQYNDKECLHKRFEFYGSGYF